MQTPLALGASLLAVLIWLISRRRPQLSMQPADRLAGASRSPAIARVLGATSPATAPTALPGGVQQAPVQRRLQRLRQLSVAMTKDPGSRLAVMQQLQVQPDRSALPLIKRGLRDSNPAVVLAAASAINVFRGRSAAAPVDQPRLPRNAASLARSVVRTR
ncbi:MAG: hypothetical protein ACO289_10630 [Prochlorococcaceae cyanobacterium]